MRSQAWNVMGLMAMMGIVAVGLWAANRGLARVAPSNTTQPAEAEKMQVRPNISQSGYDLRPLSEERINELAKGLTDQERKILLSKDTEPPFCGLLLDNKEKGVYTCRLCGLPLFSSEAKFKSGTGWPSFFKPFDDDHILYKHDTSHGMVRTEIMCMRCGAHLGHMFEDGPPPTGQRYCLNSASLKFYKEGEDLPPASHPLQTEVAYFAGGCFWGIEDRFQQVPGVIDATSGYQGGTTTQPSYKQVCSGNTGHAETVRVSYDPAKASYRQLLEWFFKFHDPTQLNRQGPDFGTQYRSAIFAANDEQLSEAKAYIEELGKSDRFRGHKIVTAVEKASPFHEAEGYHQDYHARHGGACVLPVK